MNFTGAEPDSNAMPSNSEGEANYTLGFLIAPEAPGGGFTGAVLVTDARTRPLEFLCASPIRPTKMQSFLYGGTLWEHAVVDVIAHKLLGSLSRKLDAIFVDNASLLAARRVAAVPVIHLSRSADTANSLRTTVYKVSEDHPDDHDRANQIVGGLEQSVDLLEPFLRVTEGLKEALKQKS